MLSPPAQVAYLLPSSKTLLWGDTVACFPGKDGAPHKLGFPPTGESCGPVPASFPLLTWCHSCHVMTLCMHAPMQPSPTTTHRSGWTPRSSLRWTSGPACPRTSSTMARR